MIVIVFGLAASGKTFVGKTLAKHSSFHHEDADHWLSQEMKEYIAQKKLFTLEMLEWFTNKIITNTEKLKEKYENIVITQALYRQKNREAIKQYFGSKGDVIFLQMEAEDQVIYQRLVKRADWVFPEYAESMKQYFEPMKEAQIIRNNKEGEEEIVLQLQKYGLLLK